MRPENTYTLHGRDLRDFGFVPGHAPESNLAIAGAWDMPARVGESYYAWVDGQGIEPYVDADDIAFGGRSMTLTGTLTAPDNATLMARLEAFRDFVAGLPPTVLLTGKWGTWSVQLKKGVQAAINRRFATISIPLYEPSPDLSGEWPEQWILASGRWNRWGAWDNAAQWFCAAVVPSVDEWFWKSFGFVVSRTSGVEDIPAMREVEISQPAREGLYARGGGEPRSVTLSGWLIAPDTIAFNRNVRALYRLFGSEGLRQFHYRGVTVECFAQAGFTIAGVQVRDKVYARFACKLMEGRADG